MTVKTDISETLEESCPVGRSQTKVMVLRKVECQSDVDQSEWDQLATVLRGGFFHCYAYAQPEVGKPSIEPLFAKAIGQDGDCIGIAVGTITSPQYWPFSRHCKTAVFGSLPATREKNPEMERAIMIAIERELKSRGVFKVQICSYESPNSSAVLSSLFCQLSGRAEFYVNLSFPIEEIWNQLKSVRRNNIRKAVKLGVESRYETSLEGLEQLYRFEAASLERRGLTFNPSDAPTAKWKALLLDSKRARLLISYLNGIPVNAGLFGVFGGKAYYLASGSSAEGNKCSGPSHLLWTVIELLKAEGVTTLNLGGVSIANGEGAIGDGLYNFKKEFGATVLVQPAGVKTISPLGAKLHNALQLLKQMAKR